MNVFLKQMEIENFKGIRNLIIDFSRETTISGENGSGKTSIFDAFSWCAWGKDSHNNAKFKIKTLDSSGNAINKIDHSVSILLVVDGEEVKFKKTYAENWKRTRGQAAPETYSSHVTTYFVDDVPVTKNAYDEKIKEIADEDLFMLVTNPNYFNNLHWTDQRQILFEILGKVPVNEVIDKKEELRAIAEFLSKENEEDFLKKIKAQISKINKQLEIIPLRIDECNKNLVDRDFGALETRKAYLETEIKKLDQDAEDIKNNGAGIAKLQAELRQLQNDYSQKFQYANEELKLKKNELNFGYSKLVNELKSKENLISSTIDSIARSNKTIEYATQRHNDLRSKYIEVASQEFNLSVENKCPTCGQELPQNVIDNKIANLKFNFDKNIKKQMEEVAAQGKDAAKSLEAAKEELKELHNRLNILKSSKEEIEKQLNAAKEKYNSLPEAVEVENAAEYQKAISELKTKINNFTEDNRIEEINNLKGQYFQEVSKIIDQLAAKEYNNNLKVRIQDLNEERNILSDTLSELEQKEYLGEEYIRTKVNLYEEKINKMFNKVRFVLFEKQVNGGINETCQCSVNGVPFKDLNSAMKINAGIEIINILCSYYNITAPIFIDNVESVNQLEATNSQIIKLQVTTGKGLKVEGIE